MEYDASRVFTAKDAHKLKVGSKVVCADNLYSLKFGVENELYITTLKDIMPEDCMLRFKVKEGEEYALAYLIELPEEKKLKWTDLKIGDTVRRKNGKLEFLVTGIDYDYKSVFFGDDWSDDEGLENWEKVEEINNGGKNA